mmetsp:Transcript_87959/g.138860  ORF Transcript_87959/g.138860 Transcript_87959/m.138860 type:complete len:749 (+) Transcript_87959:42-2288(+)
MATDGVETENMEAVTETSKTSPIVATDQLGSESRSTAAEDDTAAKSSSDEEEEEEADDSGNEEDDMEQCESEACDSDDSSGSQIRWTEEDQVQWNSEVHRDYYEVLGLSRSSAHISASRVRAAYHKLASRLHPRKVVRHHFPAEMCLAKSAEPAAVLYRKKRREVKLEALRRFWALMEAFLVFKDPERKRIYDECGLEGLRKSESCYAEPIFEKDAFEVYEAFFAGEDPEDREFLLMNGAGQDDWSDDEGSEGENDAELDDLARAAIRAARAATERTEAAGGGPEAAGHAAGNAFASVLEAKRRRTEALEAQLPPEMRGQVLDSSSSSSSSTPIEAEWSSLVSDALSRTANRSNAAEVGAIERRMQSWLLQEVPETLELPSSMSKEVPVVKTNERHEEQDVPVEETSVNKADESLLIGASSVEVLPAAAAEFLAPLPAELPAAAHTTAEVPAIEVPAPQVPAAVIPPADVLEVEVPSVADLLEQHLLADVEKVPVIEVPSVSSGQLPPLQAGVLLSPLPQAGALWQAEVPAAEVLAVELSPRRHVLTEASSAEHSVEEIPTIIIPAAHQPLLMNSSTEEVPADVVPAGEQTSFQLEPSSAEMSVVAVPTKETPAMVPANVVPAEEQASFRLEPSSAEISVVAVPTKETPAMVLLPSEEAPATPMLATCREAETSTPVLASASLHSMRKRQRNANPKSARISTRRLHSSRLVYIWRGALAAIAPTVETQTAKRRRLRTNGAVYLRATHR